MKKLVTWIIVSAMALLLAACGSNQDAEGTSTKKDVQTQPQAVIEKDMEKEPEETATENEGLTVVEPSAEEFVYNYDSVLGGVKITGYNGKAQEIRIPAELDGNPVKQVSLKKSNITYIELPDSVTEIKFEGCSSLTEITIPDSVRTIGISAFKECSSLTEITIPDSVTWINKSAFQGCSSLIKITIPDGVKGIDECAFQDCSSLSEVTISDSVTEIGVLAFVGCSSLTKITIPNSVTRIGMGAFSGCSSLTQITIPDGITVIGESTFSGCSSLIEVTIPDSVTEITPLAFAYCTSLRNLTIPDSVNISAQAFPGCDDLKVTYQGQEYTCENDPGYWWAPFEY